MDIKEFWEDSSPKKININESVNDITQESSDDDDDDTSVFDKIGYILIQYEDILNSENLEFMIQLYLLKFQNSSEDQKFLFKKITHVIKKYKDDITEEIINAIVDKLKIFNLKQNLTEDNKINKIHIQNYLQYVNKIIDEYLDVMNESSIIMYINSVRDFVDLNDDIIL